MRASTTMVVGEKSDHGDDNHDVEIIEEDRLERKRGKKIDRIETYFQL
jgi:hypothetical protein